MVSPSSTASLYAVLVRIANARAKLAGGQANVLPASASMEEITAALEAEAALFADASLAAVVARIEVALAKTLGKDVGSVQGSGALNAELLTARLEQLCTFLPNAGHHEQSAAAPASLPVQIAAPAAAAAPAPVAAAAAPAAAPKPAAAAPAPVAAAAAPAPVAAAKPVVAAAAAPAPVAAAKPVVAAAAAPAPVAAAKPAVVATPAAAAPKPAAAAAPAPAAAKPAVVPAAAAAAAPAAAASSGKTYTYEELKAAKKIDGVDWAQREQVLSDAEFVTVFKMTKAEFNALAGWKKQEKKKAANLF